MSNPENFTTTPSKIALEHQRDVASLVQEGVEAACKNLPKTAVQIVGQFNWEGAERRSDRYGGIMLLGPHESQFDHAPNVSLEPFRPFIGRRVIITAKVLQTRESYHVGDLARGISPKTPNVGWVVELGIGTVRSLDKVGELDHLIFQRDGTGSHDWMDPTILYQLHHQTVELTIYETDAPAVAPVQEGNVIGFTATVLPVGDSQEKPGWTDYQMKVRSDHA